MNAILAPRPPKDEWTLDRALVVDQVAARLREKILGGELPAGARLHDSRLAPLFEVSRNTVREACRALVAEGLAEHHPHRGFAVRTLTPEDARDVYALRLCLELAAARDGFDQLGARLPALRRSATALRAATRRGRFGEAIDVDLAFHATLVSVLPAERLVRAHRAACDELRIALVALDRAERQPERLAASHDGLVDWIERGDRPGLVRALKRHLSESRDRLVAALDARVPEAERLRRHKLAG